MKPLLERTVFAIDLDGVIYHGNQLISGADQAIQRLRKMGKKVIFLTNNSEKSPREIHEKLLSLGVSCHQQEIFSSGQAAVTLILEKALSKENGTYVVGSESLKNLAITFGIRVVDSLAKSVDSVLVGYDHDFNYQTLTVAANYVRAGSTFVACNRDSCVPIENHQYLPGTGSLVAAIEVASERAVDFLVGKPSVYILNSIVSRFNYPLNQYVIIGDREESDIQLAKSACIPSVLIRPFSQKSARSVSEFQSESLMSFTDSFEKEMSV